jgi:site-specific recombinase XerC
VPPFRPEPLDRLPGSSSDDPFLRLAAGWLVGHPANIATVYRRDLQAWARWCCQLGVHPLAAERHTRSMRGSGTSPPSHSRRPGRPAMAATMARKLSALAGFYDYGVYDARVLTHSPAASVRRPRVPTNGRRSG